MDFYQLLIAPAISSRPVILFFFFFNEQNFQIGYKSKDHVIMFFYCLKITTSNLQANDVLYAGFLFLS